VAWLANGILTMEMQSQMPELLMDLIRPAPMWQTVGLWEIVRLGLPLALPFSAWVTNRQLSDWRFRNFDGIFLVQAKPC